jgi:hypothetical protein
MKNNSKNIEDIMLQLKQEQNEFNRKYPNEKDKLIYWILNSLNVNDVKKEELQTWTENDLQDYLGTCNMIAEERMELESGIHWKQSK